MYLKQVPAEMYEAVTVYFSDIVGFTEIAARCTPLEVCDNFVYEFIFDEGCSKRLTFPEKYIGKRQFSLK